ncbi:hypothetical protein MD484_g3118, partial [Candolleomyces efflorescens]
MSQPPPKKDGFWRRVFRRRGNRPTGPHQGPANVANPGNATSDSEHASMHSAPTLLLPTGASTLQGHERQPAIPQPLSANNLTQNLHLSLSTNQASPHHHHIPSAPSQVPHDDPIASGSHGGLTPSARGQSEPSGSEHRPTHDPDRFLPQAASTSPFLQVPPPPGRPSRSEDPLVESLNPAGLSAPRSGDPSRQPSHQSLPPAPSPQLYDHTTVPRTPKAATSILAGAHGFNVRDILVHYHGAPQMLADRGGRVGGSSIDGWKLLMEKTATNALHNSDARYDAPKCDEDTRVEVTNELMEWMQDRTAPQRLLCMTGAAGAGKSYLQQTAAKKCGKSGILAASYFISSTDPTRNTVEPIIPTIAYQLGRKNKHLKSSISTVIEEDPLIFDQSLEAQTTAFIVEPFQRMKRTGADLHDLPYVILIDGLDECGSTDPKHKAEDRQAELLTAIRRCLLENDLPFRIFIASRPEWAIRTALQAGGYLHDLAYHIQLSDKYDATADMRRYLHSRFKEIGLRNNSPQWFSEDEVETLVKAGSGQFIYVATVYKFISERRTSPRARLDAVLRWTPREGQAARPFKGLDALYYRILWAAKEAYEAVDTHRGRDFLLLFRVHHTNISKFRLYSSILFSYNPSYPADCLSALLCLEPQAEETLVSDLRSLAALEKDEHGDLCLRLYHKSFSDFLEEPSRAKDLFVPESRVYMHLARCLMQLIIKCPLDFDCLPANWDEFSLSELHRRCLKDAVEDLPHFLASPTAALDDAVVGFTQNGGWQKVDKLLPLLTATWGGLFPKSWPSSVHQVSDKLKYQNPETAAVIKGFAEKWDDDIKRHQAEEAQRKARRGW